MEIVEIALDRLVVHPGNANVMREDLLEKLAGHIGRTGRYPPLVVRSVGGSDGYQILDGHQRARVLEGLGHITARCVVWDVEDGEAELLLATLNRLEGYDDPRKRAALVAGLRERFGEEELAGLLPEQAEGLERLMRLHAPPPVPREPVGLEEMCVAVHFFLLPSQRRELEGRLGEIGGTREEALMGMVGCDGGVEGADG